MKLLALIFITICLGSCGEDSSGDATPCANSKEIFSTWTSNDTGRVYDMSAGAFDTVLEVKFGAGACDDLRGDFLIVIASDDTVAFADCANSTILDAGTYSKTCNVLTINYDSGSTESFR